MKFYYYAKLLHLLSTFLNSSYHTPIGMDQPEC